MDKIVSYQKDGEALEILMDGKPIEYYVSDTPPIWYSSGVEIGYQPSMDADVEIRYIPEPPDVIVEVDVFWGMDPNWGSGSAPYFEPRVVWVWNQNERRYEPHKVPEEYADLRLPRHVVLN